MKRALVTGATGFVGANLTRLLLERSRRVQVLVRPGADRGNLVDLDVRVVEGDLRDPKSLREAVRGCEEVYHVAADYRFWMRNTSEIFENNVQGTRNLLEECKHQGIPRIVYTSTVGAIGLRDQPRPCNEKTELDPHQVTSLYKRSKIDAENVALRMAQEGLPVVIVNPSTPIGPWDRKPTPTGKIIVDFIRGKMPGYVETGLNFVHVRDVAHGHILAAEKGKVGSRYILGNQNIPLGEFLGMIAEITGLRAPRLKVPYSVAWASGWLSTRWADWVTRRPPAVPLEAVKMSRRFMYFDSAKAVRELGMPQTPVKQALAEAIEWFSRNGYFPSRKLQTPVTPTEGKVEACRFP